LNGFNELMCRCGLAFNGPPGQDEGTDITLHGRIANLPAHRLELTASEETGAITLTGVVEEARFLCHQLRMTTSITPHRQTSCLPPWRTSVHSTPWRLAVRPISRSNVPRLKVLPR
jgi:hypothetical protein